MSSEFINVFFRTLDILLTFISFIAYVSTLKDIFTKNLNQLEQTQAIALLILFSQLTFFMCLEVIR